MSSRTVFLLVFFMVFAFSGAVHSEEQYRAEVSAAYLRYDPAGEGRSIEPQASVEVFFSPVRTDNHPYAEAAFLEQIGSVGLSATDANYRSGDSKADGRSYELFVNLTSPDLPVVVTALVQRSNSDYEYSPLPNYRATTHDNTDLYSLSLGTYLTKGLLARIGYADFRNEARNIMISELFPTVQQTETNTSGKQYFAVVKYVREAGDGSAYGLVTTLMKFRSNAKNLLLERSAFMPNVQTDESVGYLAFDRYFTRRLSAGVDVQVVDSENRFSNGETYGVNARYFVTPRISFRAGYQRFLNGDPNLNDRNYSITVAARF